MKIVPKHRRARSIRRVERRQVVALLLTGGGIAIGTGSLGLAILGIASKIELSLHHPVASLTGAVIGAITQVRNSATAFLNPRDGKQSLLVHLPDGAFAAYERACTHRGVLVNYDPATHCLVCPAHGAIFDPARGGRVVQGPATEALPQIAIHLNANGAITTR